MELLEISWRRAIRVWWRLCWTGIIALVCAMIVSFVLGFTIAVIFGVLELPRDVLQIAAEIVAFAGGVISSILKLPQDAMQIVTAILGLLVGLSALVVPVKLVIGRDFGEFRLVLFGQTDGSRSRGVRE